jgi:hypothetical protein
MWKTTHNELLQVMLVLFVVRMYFYQIKVFEFLSHLQLRSARNEDFNPFWQLGKLVRDQF